MTVTLRFFARFGEPPGNYLTLEPDEWISVGSLVRETAA
jgi:hypothetical protein